MLSIGRRRFMGWISKGSLGLIAGANTASASAGAWVSSPPKTESPVNLLLILSDDHSVPYLGCYGNRDLKTPNQNRIAEEGMKFTRAYTTAPQCVPSRASLMTGRSAVDIRMTRFTAPLDRSVVSFPELLREAGYYTGLCGRTYHLDGAAGPEASGRVFKEHHLQTFKDRVDYLRTGDRLQAIKQMEEFLNQVPQGKPFFLQIGFSDPHRSFNAKEFEPDPSSIAIPPSMPDTPLVREDLAGFYGEIERLDESVGQILNLLSARKLEENTLLIFMGDNGSALLRGKGTLYECGLNVPLIARWPGKIKRGSTCDALVSGEDLAPTFLEVGKATIPGEMTGKSFKPQLMGEPFQEREYVVAERGPHASSLPGTGAGFDLGRCVITKRYKLIYNALWQLPYIPVDFSSSQMWRDLKKRHQDGALEPKFSRAFFASQRELFELYDLEADPHEFNNLAGDKDFVKVEMRLKEILQEWMILSRDYLPLPIPKN